MWILPQHSSVLSALLCEECGGSAASGHKEESVGFNDFKSVLGGQAPACKHL